LALVGEEHTVELAVLPQLNPTTTSEVQQPRSSCVQRALALVVLLAGLTTMLVKRSLVADVFSELRSLRATAVALLIGLVVTHRFLNALLHRAATPGVRFRNMLIAAESYSGASHSFTGGAGVGTALRVGMYRSWGVDGVGIAASIVSSSVFPSFAMWILGGAYSLPLVLGGHADRNETIVGLACIPFVIGPIIFWAVLLNHGSAVKWGQGVIGSIGRRLVRLRSRRLRELGARGVDIASKGLEEVRVRGRGLVRSNGLLMLGAAIGAQVVLALILLASCWALAPEANLPVITVLRTFALLRVLSSFVPVPGGIGIVDVGLVAALETGGLSSPEAVAAIALYRALTFLLPLVSGPLCALLWWRTDGRAQVLRPVAVVSTPDLPNADPLVAA
jgi:putative heme transporter